MPSYQYGKSVLAGRNPKSFKNSDVNESLYKKISQSNKRAKAVKQGIRLRCLVDDEESIDRERELRRDMVTPVATVKEMKPLVSFRRSLLSFDPNPSTAHMTKAEASKITSLSSLVGARKKTFRLKKLTIKAKSRRNETMKSSKRVTQIERLSKMNVSADVAEIAAADKEFMSAGAGAGSTVTAGTIGVLEKPKRVLRLSEELSKQPNKPLHFGMELALENLCRGVDQIEDGIIGSADGGVTDGSFLGCCHPSGDVFIKSEVSD